MKMMEKIKYKNMQLLPPKSDVVFKAIFGSEECKDVLCAFLTDVLDIEIPDFKAIELVNNELVKEYQDDKLSRLDIRVKTGNNENIEIEIQLLDNRNMIQRSIYYTSKLFAAQMTEGMKYNTELTDLIEISYLELEKFRELINVEKLNKLQLHELTSKEKWAVFLTTQNEEVLQMLAKENEVLNKAVDKLVFVSAEEKLRFEYEQRQKALKDHYCDIEDAREQGKIEGKIEGKLNTLTRLLTKKLGVMPHELKARFEKASDEKLNVIAESIFDIESFDDLKKLL